jgi:hypothetical protein
MLAPLEGLRVPADDADLAADIRDLRREVVRLQALCDDQRRQLDEYASGTAIIDLGRKLMEFAEANTQLREAAVRAVRLERALVAAGAETSRLTAERDALRRRLQMRPAMVTTGEA